MVGLTTTWQTRAMTSSLPPPFDWFAAGKDHVWRPYCQHQTAPDPLRVVRTHGCRLVLDDGRELVDGTASWWTAAHGYNHPHIRARVQQQLEVLPHVAFGGLAHEAGYSLCTRLAALLPDPLNRVFVVESGSVAVEVALKIAMQAAHQRGEDRHDVIAFSGGYHGDTFATMSLCDPHEGMHRAFSARPALRVHHLAVPSSNEGADDDGFDAAFAAVAEHAAACVIEPLVQAASGMRFHDVNTLKRIREACTRHGVTLIFDEIATGFFRTGSRFAVDELVAAGGAVPDVVVVGKALSGGTLPLAAVIATDALFADFSSTEASHALQHGPTYMANALACAAAHGSLDLFEAGDFSTTTRRLSAKLGAALAPLSSLPSVRDVRVKGAIAVVEVDSGTAPASSAFAAHGAFVRPLRFSTSDVVYLMPPLVIGDRDLDVLTRAVVDTLSASG